MKRFLTFEKRMAGTTGNVVLVRIASVAAAVLATVLILLCAGLEPPQVAEVLSSMFIQTFFSIDGLFSVIVKSIPLIITSVGISLAFKMKLWNIGGEGQIAMGAFAAAGVAMAFPNLAGWLLLPLMAVAAMLAGGLWAGIAAAPKAYLGVNETITTLMLNYVALIWLQYLINGPWATNGFPLAPPISGNARMPALNLFNNELHLGILIAAALVAAYYFLLYRSRWGYEIRVTGESLRAAEYAGINVRRNMLAVLMLSGAIAGIAGMGEVAGMSHRLEMTISGNFGYTAIIIAWLARLNPWGVVAMSVFMAALMVGGQYAAGIPNAVPVMIQGVILFFVLGFDLFTQYKVRFHFGRKEAKQ
jgi:ABC-type uncharacterized transport system permease subunit